MQMVTREILMKMGMRFFGCILFDVYADVPRREDVHVRAGFSVIVSVERSLLWSSN